MTGDIMSISRLRMSTDGKGLSTLIALYSCPLKCRYCFNNHCHDPEYRRGAFTVNELIRVLEKDDIYYKMTDGGIVFGGGEPLLQYEFISAVFVLADKEWKKRIETSLNVPWENIKSLINLTDEWIIDIKDMNHEIYKEYTGQDNSRVISNLSNLIKSVSPEKLHIRVPIIPGFNTGRDVDKSVEKLKDLGFQNIEVFCYDTISF